jgi:hypothetical protein
MEYHVRERADLHRALDPPAGVTDVYAVQWIGVHAEYVTHTA